MFLHNRGFAVDRAVLRLNPLIVYVIIPFLLPLLSMCILRWKLEYAWAELFVLNALVSAFTGLVMWLHSERVANMFLQYSGHSYGKANEGAAALLGVHRISPVLPACVSLFLMLISFWHVVVMILLAVM
ncbi:hypothetical protein DPX39_070067000 [Trypanosoma brucei equiperdum]|uniref:Uncharacterized protein n=1 Tax=Trypanosoma brucei equiperdum TaxID=630700 RepID=A0A3L6L4R4_9TRYP|nr:hypothetical protein DPX39_070067000 [Trypanosoma brucei equiperdum]